MTISHISKRGKILVPFPIGFNTKDIFQTTSVAYSYKKKCFRYWSW